MKIKATNTPQPAFGSWVTAGAGLNAPSDVPIILTLGDASDVADNDATQLFKAGEEAWLVNPDNTHGEPVKIMSIAGNTVTLGPQTTVTPTRSNPVTLFAHPVGPVGTGAYLIPKQLSNNVLVWYEDGGTGPWLYIGKTPDFTSTINRLFKLAFTTTGTPPAFWNAGLFSPGDPIDLSELYVSGLIGDHFFTSVGID